MPWVTQHVCAGTEQVDCPHAIVAPPPLELLEVPPLELDDAPLLELDPPLELLDVLPLDELVVLPLELLDVPPLEPPEPEPEPLEPPEPLPEPPPELPLPPSPLAPASLPERMLVEPPHATTRTRAGRSIRMVITRRKKLDPSPQCAPRSHGLQPLAEASPNSGSRWTSVVSRFRCNLREADRYQRGVALPRPMRVADDLELARRCCSGERAAQRALFQRERGRVHATLFRVLGSNTEMDDLVQEAFLEIFKSLRAFRGDASLGTWIDRITVRVAIAHIRRRKARPVPLAIVPDPPSRDPSAEQRAMTRQAARRLYAVLDGLEARLRIAWTLYVLEGRSVAEIASLMEATPVLTRVRVWRATRAIEAAAAADPLLAEFAAGASTPPKTEVDA